MAFTIPTFDELLNGILTDYVNQFPGVDISKGSLVYVKSAAHASALWGLYQHQRWIADQIFPDTSDPANLEHHAWVRGITRTSGESDAALLARLLDYIRRPPAGGNRYDYVKWALEVDKVQSAVCIPTGQGPGTVDVVIVMNPVLAGYSIPTTADLAAVYDHIVDLHPAASLLTRILAPEIISQNITIILNAAGVNPAVVTQDVTNYVNQLAIGQSLSKAQLISLVSSKMVYRPVWREFRHTGGFICPSYWGNTNTVGNK
jgi:uncharacterized phage protein gp47/JayE